jgi:uncharacterized membrane protein
MEALAPFHPAFVHAPIALLIVGVVFELIGRGLDSAWMRKAATALLVIGFAGACLAYLSGAPAGEHAEHRGVPEQAVDAHEGLARLTLWLAGATLLARLLGARGGKEGRLLSGLALLLYIATAISVGATGFRGGKLVFEHGAGVTVNGKAVSGPEGEKPGD